MSPACKRYRTLPLLVLAVAPCVLASTHAAPLSCLSPVPGVTWLRWEQGQQTLDDWCQSVGPPVFASAPDKADDIFRLLILSWNAHVGGGDVEQLIADTVNRSPEEAAGVRGPLQ